MTDPKLTSLAGRREIDALRSEVAAVETFAQSLKAGQDAVAKAIHQQSVKIDAIVEGQSRMLAQLARLNERADNLDAGTLENIAAIATASKQLPVKRLVDAETSLATVRAELVEVRSQLGAPPRDKDLARASYSDITPEEIAKLERGYGLRGQVAILLALSKRSGRASTAAAGGAALLALLELARAVAPLFGG